MHDPRLIVIGVTLLFALTMLLACAPDGTASGDEHADDAAGEPSTADVRSASERAQPPEAIRAWMDRLTVDHDYDPQTGFIVAREIITLPSMLADAPPLDALLASADRDTLVIAFATADRCAPCQQFKKDALNDHRVMERLSDPRLVTTHVEVDRRPDLADTYLGGRAIPMTYALRNGERVATLRGQRSAEDLLAWLDTLLEPGADP